MLHCDDNMNVFHFIWPSVGRSLNEYSSGIIENYTTAWMLYVSVAGLNIEAAFGVYFLYQHEYKKTQNKKGTVSIALRAQI